MALRVLIVVIFDLVESESKLRKNGYEAVIEMQHFNVIFTDRN